MDAGAIRTVSGQILFSHPKILHFDFNGEKHLTVEFGACGRLLGEGVAELHRGAFGRAVSADRVSGENGCPADTVAAGASTEQHHFYCRRLAQ
jgi:hypothetical protein